MYGLASIKAINGWSNSKECKAILENARLTALTPVIHSEAHAPKKVVTKRNVSATVVRND